jgi:hypothetical protein
VTKSFGATQLKLQLFDNALRKNEKNGISPCGKFWTKIEKNSNFGKN